MVNESLCCRLRQKIACKVRDEHYRVKDLPPPSEAVAKVAAKAMPSAVKHCEYLYVKVVAGGMCAGVSKIRCVPIVQLECRLALLVVVPTLDLQV